MRERVSIIDPLSNESNTFDPLASASDYASKESIATAIVDAFRSVHSNLSDQSTQWNAQTSDILRNSVLLLLVNGRDLTALPSLLSEFDFRDALLEISERQKRDFPAIGTLLEAWARYRRLMRTEQWIDWVAPILLHINAILADERLARLIQSGHREINLAKVINDRGVLLVRLPHSQIGSHSSLVGSLLVALLNQRADAAKYTVVVRQLDSFIDDELFDSMTSESTGKQLGLIASIGTMRRISESYRLSLQLRTGTICAFPMSKFDADTLAPQMFRVDGRRTKSPAQFVFNNGAQSPRFDLISDEQLASIDRLVAQEAGTFFCYRVGTLAGLVRLKAPASVRGRTSNQVAA